MTLRRPSPAMCVALLALFVAMSGTSYAAVVVTGKDVKNRSLTGKDVKPDSLGGTQVAEATLGTVPSATTAGSATSATSAATAQRAASAATADTAQDAARLGGVAAGQFARLEGPLPSGTTVRGVWGLSHPAGAAAGTLVELPGVAPAAPVTVNFAPGAFASDDDPTCTGSSENPTAPAGKVCVYLALRAFNTQGVLSAEPGSSDLGNGFVDRRSFRVTIAPADQPGLSSGTWAYTTP